MSEKTDQDFTIRQGDNIVIEITITDVVTGVVKDVTGATDISWAASRNFVDDPASLDKTGSVSDGPNGKVQITLTAANTASLSPDKYEHQCRVTDASGNISTITTGTLTILASLHD